MTRNLAIGQETNGAAGAQRDYLIRWLEQAARALAKRTSTLEKELADGRYIATEEWPSRSAYLAMAQHRMTMEAMLKTHDEAARRRREPRP